MNRHNFDLVDDKLHVSSLLFTPFAYKIVQACSSYEYTFITDARMPPYIPHSGKLRVLFLFKIESRNKCMIAPPVEDFLHFV